MIPDDIFDFLPGKILIRTGGVREYRMLHRFHYRTGFPATWSLVRVAWFERQGDLRPVGVVVLSYPTPFQSSRQRVFGMKSWSLSDRLKWINQNLRTISRVIIHPQFRSIGLARRLVQDTICRCPTRYVESSARMGRAHPLFQTCGMNRVDPDDPSKPVYYWLDRTVLNPFAWSLYGPDDTRSDAG
ncbi:MAG: hypothetical protein KatS3mg104_2623 [Phycisphaerae bacterium]|jgi:GNAT superfamily N-acetyltransferase|nr:MAG: hypothetical protein KatS3mg104_2623 [Phycisphaerae bacterium]